MKSASLFLIGEHDFRNFCKMDVGNGVVEFRRRIIDVQIEAVNDEKDGGYSMYKFKLVGQAFLWVNLKLIKIMNHLRFKDILFFLYSTRFVA